MDLRFRRLLCVGGRRCLWLSGYAGLEDAGAEGLGVDEVARFRLVFADISAPAKIDPTDKSARLTFDTDGGQLPEVLKLIAFGGGVVLEGTFYEADVQPKAESRGSSRVRRVGAIPSE